MTDRWFSEQELEQLSRPTMDRAVEAIDAGDLEGARRLCKEMKHEWQMLHDLMAAGVLDLVSFIQQRLGEEGVAEAWTQSMNRGWRRHHDAIVALDRRELVRPAGGDLAGALVLGRGPQPGRLHDQRGRGEGHLHDEPLRVRSAAGAQRRLRGPARRRPHARGARLVLRPQGLPAVLHPLQLHERVAADPVVGLSAVPVRSARGTTRRTPAPGTGTRTPTTIPERHYEPLRRGQAGLSCRGAITFAGSGCSPAGAWL